MRWHALMIVAACLLLAADAPNDASKQALKKLQGTWGLAAEERAGQKTPDDALGQVKVTLAGDQFTVKRGDKTIEQGSVILYPAAKKIDLMFTLGEKRGQTRLGIYRLDGDTLHLLTARQVRPSAFAAKTGAGQLLQVLKREKP